MKRTLLFVLALGLLSTTPAQARLRRSTLCLLYPTYPTCVNTTPVSSEPPTGGGSPTSSCTDNPAACAPPPHPAYIVPGTPRTLSP